MQIAGLRAGQHSGSEKAGQETAPGEEENAGQRQAWKRSRDEVQDKMCPSESGGDKEIELEWPSTPDSAVR